MDFSEGTPIPPLNEAPAAYRTFRTEFMSEIGKVSPERLGDTNQSFLTAFRSLESTPTPDIHEKLDRTYVIKRLRDKGTSLINAEDGRLAGLANEDKSDIQMHLNRLTPMSTDEQIMAALNDLYPFQSLQEQLTAHPEQREEIEAQMLTLFNEMEAIISGKDTEEKTESKQQSSQSPDLSAVMGRLEAQFQDETVESLAERELFTIRSAYELSRISTTPGAEGVFVGETTIALERLLNSSTPKEVEIGNTLLDLIAIHNTSSTGDREFVADLITSLGEGVKVPKYRIDDLDEIPHLRLQVLEKLRQENSPLLEQIVKITIPQSENDEVAAREQWQSTIKNLERIKQMSRFRNDDGVMVEEINPAYAPYQEIKARHGDKLAHLMP